MSEGTPASSSTATSPKPFRSLMQTHRSTAQTGVIFLVALFLATLLSGGVFLQPANLRNLLLQGAILGVVALGQLLVVLTGGIDLSVGAAVAISSVLFVLLQDHGVVLAAAAALGGALVIGLINGSTVAALGLPAFVVTLAVSEVAMSLTQVLTGGASISTARSGTAVPESVTTFGSGTWGGLPTTSLVWLVVLVAIVLGLRTRNGSFIYPVGGNERAANFSAVPVVKVKLLAYAGCSLLAGIGGLLFVARIGTGDPQAGTPYLLDSIAAVVIGGASLFGGRGTASGTLIGVLILGILNNLVNLLGVSPSLQYAVKGVVILLAVILTTQRKRS